MEKMLITKLVLRPDGNVNLFGHGRRFRDLILFDASDLQLVGIDPTQLSTGVETPCRFWAYYEVSGKLNSNGNPYLDIRGLEPFALPPDTELDSGALIREVVAIKTLLLTLVRALVDEEPDPDAELRYTNGTTPDPDNPAELNAFRAFLSREGRPPSSRGALRDWAKDL